MEPSKGRVALPNGSVRALWFVACLSMALPVGGCSRNTGPSVQFVQGRVLLDGEPLANAWVGFSPAGTSGLSASGQTDDSGTFRLTSSRAGGRGRGATEGTYVVTVQKFRNRVAELGDAPALETDPEGHAKWYAEADRVGHLPPESLIPAAYGDKAVSPLRAEVKKGRNAFTFELTKDSSPAR